LLDSARQLSDQPLSIERRLYLDVVVEIAVNVAMPAARDRRVRDAPSIARLRSSAPRGDPLGPPIERRLAVAAGVELLVAMKAQIDEVGGYILAVRPFPGGIGDHERDAMSSQQSDERRIEKAFVTDLDSVADSTAAIDRETSPAFDACIASASERERPLSRARELREECIEALRVVCEGGRELPKKRTELVAQLEQPRREEVGKWLLDLTQALHVGDEARPLDREHEIRRCIVVPGPEAFRSLQRIEGSVDLDRG